MKKLGATVGWHPYRLDIESAEGLPNLRLLKYRRLINVLADLSHE